MLTSDFNFDLPEELIAQHPSGVRGQDKLMLLNRVTGEVEHHMMDDLPDLIEPGTLMVFNNSILKQTKKTHKFCSCVFLFCVKEQQSFVRFHYHNLSNLKKLVYD